MENFKTVSTVVMRKSTTDSLLNRTYKRVKILMKINKHGGKNV
jgi:hypothetical protein